MQDVVVASPEEALEAPARLVRRLRRLDLEPLLEPLTRLLAASPDDAALREWAARHPDKWANSVVSLAKIVGYAERRQVDVSVAIDIGAMSDSQLEAALAARVARLGLVAAGAASAEGTELAKLEAPGA